MSDVEKIGGYLVEIDQWGRLVIGYQFSADQMGVTLDKEEWRELLAFVEARWLSAR